MKHLVPVVSNHNQKSKNPDMKRQLQFLHLKRVGRINRISIQPGIPCKEIKGPEWHCQQLECLRMLVSKILRDPNRN